MNLPGWTREPLLHFLAAGAAIWLVLAWQGEPVDPASRTIAVTREDRARLALQWEKTFQRPPTDAELDGLTEQFIREEVLYREAIRLGLDRDDAVLRKRLANKMDYLAASMAETASVSDDTLKQWLDKHPERFAPDVRYTFDQRWFAEREAAERARGRADPVSEPISLPATLDRAPRGEVEKQFGLDFAETLDRIRPDNRWQGPVPSGFGWHVVRLRARSVSPVPPLAQIRDQVEADWRTDTAAERKEQGYRLLRDSYRITIDR
ncbi:MAG: peptidyl-prolyl cis-trans isomerase [Novosphingobium sp.]